jgi:hypothetical protein
MLRLHCWRCCCQLVSHLGHNAYAEDGRVTPTCLPSSSIVAHQHTITTQPCHTPAPAVRHSSGARSPLALRPGGSPVEKWPPPETAHSTLCAAWWWCAADNADVCCRTIAANHGAICLSPPVQSPQPSLVPPDSRSRLLQAHPPTLVELAADCY